MKYIFILVCLLTLSCHNNQKVKQVKGGTITIEEFDTPSTEIEMSLSEEDSLLYLKLWQIMGIIGKQQ